MEFISWDGKVWEGSIEELQAKADWMLDSPSEGKFEILSADRETVTIRHTWPGGESKQFTIKHSWSVYDTIRNATFVVSNDPSQCTSHNFRQWLVRMSQE